MKDEMGDRFKKYESVNKHSLIRRSYTIIRIDGKSFHTYTKGLERPFDGGLIEDMDATTRYLCENIQGAKLGYTQSDEISILLTDFDNLESQAWFDGEIQKTVSVAASLATAKFNQKRFNRLVYDRTLEKDFKLAHFDARVFQLPTRNEVINYFIWRQKDCIRNSVSTVAQANFSAKELHGKNRADKLLMLADKGIDWESFSDGKKYGREAIKESYEIPYPVSIQKIGENPTVTRTRWVSVDAQPFNMHHFLADHIPINL